jgi:hypothetical protein
VDALVDAGYALNEIMEQWKKNMSKHKLKFQDELEEKLRKRKMFHDTSILGKKVLVRLLQIFLLLLIHLPLIPLLFF